MSSFKTIYFPDYNVGESSKSGLTIPFSENEKKLFLTISNMSSYSIRTAIGHNLYAEVVKAAEDKNISISAYVRHRLSQSISTMRGNSTDYDAAIQSTFSGGKGSPLHDWFPYLEGYSPDFVSTVIKQYAPNANRVFDPFCGSGTTAITAARMGINSSYCEVNPVCRDVIAAKVLALKLTSEERRKVCEKLEKLSAQLPEDLVKYSEDCSLSQSFRACFGTTIFFNNTVYSNILKLRSMADHLTKDDPNAGTFFEIAILGALVPSSLLVRRGDLRFRTEKELTKHTADLIQLVSKRLGVIASDLSDLPTIARDISLVGLDARFLRTDGLEPVDIVLTSPPYLNGTNYFRNTKIELWFQRHLNVKGDLRKFRDSAVTSGINDVTNSKTMLSQAPDISLLTETIEKLKSKSYDKRISMMAASYFAEMAEVVRGIKKICHDQTVVAIDLGDSCYGDVWVRTDIILREIMQQQGFIFEDEVILRERQSRDGRRLKQTLQIFGTRP